MSNLGNKRQSNQKPELKEPKILNRTFYQFVFSFIAVIAGTLFFIIILGISSGA